MVIVPINAAERIETDTKEGKEAAKYYNNLTTHMWACFRDLLKSGDIVIEDDAETFGQLSSRKYRVASNGKIEIEPKKEMKTRGLGSPDRADAITLSTYLGKMSKYTGHTPIAMEKETYWG